MATRKKFRRSVLNRSTPRRVAGDNTAAKTGTIIALLAFGRINQTPIKKENIIRIPAGEGKTRAGEGQATLLSK